MKKHINIIRKIIIAVLTAVLIIPIFSTSYASDIHNELNQEYIEVIYSNDTDEIESNTDDNIVIEDDIINDPSINNDTCEPIDTIINTNDNETSAEEDIKETTEADIIEDSENEIPENLNDNIENIENNSNFEIDELIETETININDEQLNDTIPEYYEVTYILNGGKNSSNNIEKLPVNFKLILSEPKRAGYTFSGWFKKTDNTRVTTIKNTNITIYAKWTPIIYTVKLNTNGGILPEGSLKTFTYTNISPKIDLPTPTRQHYIFGGWYKDSLFKEKIDYIYSGSLGKLNLYAKWNHITHSINYYMNDSSTDPVILSSKHITYFNEATSAKLYQPTRTGFTFNGFYKNNPNSIHFDVNEKKLTSIPANTTTDVTIYANWIEHSYKLSFNANGGSFTAPIEIEAHKYTDNITLPQNTAVNAREGYLFKGWNTRKDGKGTHFEANTVVSRLSSKNKSNITLYAEWYAIEYGVFCDYRGGNMFDANGNPLNPRYHTVEKTLKLKKPKKTGYLFDGWYKNRELSGLPTSIIPKTAQEENYYAAWSPIKYKIVFKPSGGKGTMKSLSCKYDQSYIIPSNSFTKKIERTKYEFVEWNTKSNGTGISYNPGDEISNLASVDGKSISLYAIWKKIE